MSEDQEEKRLNTLKKYNILDSLPEKDFDDITKIAAQICEVPIALISFVDKKRQWFKSHHGLDTNETPREYSFCAHAIETPRETFVVPNSLEDDRFKDNPLVTGKPHVIFYAGTPLVSPEGEALGTLCVIDNTPRTLSESQLEALEALASQVVGQMELRKKVGEMEKLTEKLENANDALDRFAYSCSHDIKAPLANITLLSKMLTDKYGDVLTGIGQKCLLHIQTSVDKVNHLVDGVLTYSRIPQMVSMDKAEVNVEELVQEVSQMITVPDSMKIVVESQNNIVLTNKVALQQILLNLIGNAIKYNDKPEGLLTLNVERVNGKSKFVVKDNGPGIAPKNQKKIFEVFQTLGIKDRYGKTGSGIGLATVKTLVERLGGNISLVSDIGKGCEFIFLV